MRKTTFLTILIALMLVPLSHLAAETLYPKVIENVTEFYIYEVQQGDGLWAISKRFEVSQNELHQYNPSLANGLKCGAKIKIPVKKAVTIPQPTNNANVQYKTHVVERSQTLYAISRMYNTTVSEIIALNPQAVEGLKVGEVLKIPTPAVATQPSQATSDSASYILHEVKKKETLYSISRLYNVDINTLLENNDLADGLKKGMTLRIRKPLNSTPATTPSPAPKQETKAPATTTTATTPEPPAVAHYSDNINAQRIALLLPFKLEAGGADRSAEKFIDFYRGVLIATEQEKQMGHSTTLYVYDTSNSEAAIDSILKRPELKSVDMIIGPAYSNQIQKVTDFAKQHGIYVSIPFSQKVKDIESNPYIIQFNPSAQKQLAINKEHIATLTTHKKLIIAQLENCNDEGQQFANSLMTELLFQQKAFTTCNITASNADSICQEAIQQNALLLIASTNAERVRPILQKINLSRLGSSLKLFGFDNWGLSLLNECRPVYFCSLFNPTTKGSIDYKQLYENHFGISPSNYPSYNQLGYDIMLSAFATLKQKPIAQLQQLPVVSNIQSNINYQKVSTEGGWMNSTVSLIYLE